jgi:hypothetical protein
MRSDRLAGGMLMIVAVVLSAGVAQASVRSGPLALRHGEGVAVSGTDMVCAFGGPANKVGLACLHSGSNAKARYSFRIDEDELLAFRRAAGRTSRAGGWKEPRSRFSEPRSPAISSFKLVGRLGAGTHFNAAGTDLGCSIYSFSGTINVACFKRGRNVIQNGSYAVALGGLTLQVSRFEGGHGTTVFVGK